jgi:hypothetical protein
MGTENIAVECHQSVSASQMGAREGNMPDQSDAEYWRERAREAREQSVTRRDVEGKCAFQRIAENYEDLAEQAESINKSKMTVPY